mmetsp:Transcript_5846/g.9952  ORF Transcript_5846/g.9952 Transcript_5846/m.9952 type:complete len:169 (-) Transcript_5846:76-582(-)
MDPSSGSTEYGARYGPALSAKWDYPEAAMALRRPASSCRSVSCASSRTSSCYHPARSIASSRRPAFRDRARNAALQVVTPRAGVPSPNSASSWMRDYHSRPAGMPTNGVECAPFWQLTSDGGFVDGHFGRSEKFTNRSFFQTAQQSHTVGKSLRTTNSLSPARVARVW